MGSEASLSLPILPSRYLGMVQTVLLGGTASGIEVAAIGHGLMTMT